MSTSRLSFAGAAMALAFSAAAQSDPRVVGLTAGGTVQARDNATCAATGCTAALPPVGLPWAGGTAYDTRTRGTWITNGLSIAKVDSRSAGCVFQCSPQPIPGASTSLWATGLAYQHDVDRLWITFSDNTIRALQVAGCRVTDLYALYNCPAPVPLGHTVTGIACEDVAPRIYYTATRTDGTGVGGIVYGAPALIPCFPLCGFVVLTCRAGGTPLRPLTGVAYDSCRDEIRVTDGTSVFALSVVSWLNCFAPTVRCCTDPNAAYVGLCIAPSTEQSVGSPCSAAPCTACTPRIALGHGDPVVGNLAFTLDGRSLPAGATAATILSLGPCATPGLRVAPFCGPLLVDLAGVIGGFALPTGGTAGCDGTTSLGLPIPFNAALCDLVFSSQIVGICLGATAGTFVSECLSWRITAS